MTEHEKDPEHLDPQHHEHHVDVGSAPPVQPMSGRRLGWIGVGIVAFLLVLLVVTLVPRRSVAKELLAEVGARDSAPVVQVTTVRRGAPGSTLSLPSTIQPLHESAIYARVGGYVKRWHADIGSVVHAGEALVEIDAPELEQEVQQASSQVTQSKAALGLAKADLDRWRSLAKDSAVTVQELDQKRAAFEAATANTAAVEANQRRLTQMRQYTRVVAPFTGVVTARNVDIGSLITPAGGTSAPVAGNSGSAPGSLYRIAQVDTVRSFVSVPEAYATSIRPGLAVGVTVQSIPGRTFNGLLARTSHSLDASTRTLLTEVDIPNRDFALLPGMYASANLTFPRVTPPLVLPAATLLVRAAGVQVAIVEPGPNGTSKVRFQQVRVIRDYGPTVEISGELAEGATIVLNPSADLVDGAKVRVQKAQQ